MHLGLQVGKAEVCTLHVGWICQGVGRCFVSFSLLSSWHQGHGFICDSGAALPLSPARRPVSHLNICPKSEPPIPSRPGLQDVRSSGCGCVPVAEGEQSFHELLGREAIDLAEATVGGSFCKMIHKPLSCLF